MAFGKDFKSALKDIGEQADDIGKLAKNSPEYKWFKIIGIGIFVITAIALFLQYGGSG